MLFRHTGLSGTNRFCELVAKLSKQGSFPVFVGPGEYSYKYDLGDKIRVPHVLHQKWLISDS